MYYRLMDAYGPDNKAVITTLKYRVLRETPKGVWLVPDWASDDWPKPRFVLNGSGKRYAYTSFERAKASYKIRKERQIGHARHAIESAEARLAIIEGYTPCEHVTSQLARSQSLSPPPTIP